MNGGRGGGRGGGYGGRILESFNYNIIGLVFEVIFGKNYEESKRLGHLILNGHG